jgi:phosphoglycolate phosphatase
MSATILFDLDGTLTDPKEGITRCIQYALEKLSIEPVPEADDLLWCIGPPLQQSFRRLVGEAVAPRAVDLYRERFAEVGLFENQLYPGVRKMLAALQANGLKMKIASSKPHVYVEQIVQHFRIGDYFDSIFGAELDGTRSDKTELIDYALKQSGCVRDRATMIGDRHHDVVGAIGNRIRFVGVLYGYGDRSELAAAGAVEMVNSPQELTSLFIDGKSQ